LWARLYAACVEFWRYVDGDIVPPADWSSIDSSLQRFRWFDAAGSSIDLRGTQGAEDWAEYEAIGKQVAELNKRRDELKARFACGIGDNELARVADDREVRVIRVPGGHVEYDRAESIQLRARKCK
jgi:hypothetical protein